MGSSSPAVGYFNDDDTPDIMVHYQTGPGYPLYYSAQVDLFEFHERKVLIDHQLLRAQFSMA